MRVGGKDAFAALLLTAACAAAGYGIDRAESLWLLSIIAVWLAAYAWVCRAATHHTLRFWLCAALALRLILFFSWPTLSDDFYRFIWDGRLWLAGQHPFLKVPADFLTDGLPGLDADLFTQLNSKHYFTVYPPVAQLFFVLSAWLSPNSVAGSVAVLRLLLLAAEIGSVVLMLRLLQAQSQPRTQVLWYALNPLIVLELFGNLHFEGFVIFFLLLFLWWHQRGLLPLAAVAFALAVGVKLVPLIFLPLVLLTLSWRNRIRFSIVFVACLAAMMVPMYQREVWLGFGSSLQLYFQKFEFNASVYYLAREYGFWKYGYNIIERIAWKLAVAGGALILTYSFVASRQEREWPRSFLLIGFLHLLFSTTVHPWYIAPLVMLSVFQPLRFALVWSGVVFLSYAGYTATGYHESLWLVGLEYAVVLSYLGWELWRSRQIWRWFYGWRPPHWWRKPTSTGN